MPLTPEKGFQDDTLERYETQAERVLNRFGGARKLAEILKLIGRKKDVAAIYKWTYPKSKGGSNGRIPGCAWPDIMAAARAEGIILSPEDLDPRPVAIRRKRGPGRPSKGAA